MHNSHQYHHHVTGTVNQPYYLVFVPKYLMKSSSCNSVARCIWILRQDYDVECFLFQGLCQLTDPSALAMARYYHAHEDNGKRCSVCSNRSQIFGSRDIQTGWQGWCMECNARWYTCQFNHLIRACSRRFSVHLLNELVGSPVVSLVIRDFLLVCDRAVRRAVLTRHKFDLLHLQWQVCPVDCLQEESVEARRNKQFTIRSLKEAPMMSPQFRAQCFPHFGSRSQRFTLMDAIMTYVAPIPEPYVPRHCPEGRSIYRIGKREICWQKFERNGRFWLWSKETAECFCIDAPPEHWLRYFDMNCNGCLYSWWCSDRRWFFEPE